MVDWSTYKDLQRQEAELNRANPVTVEITWDEYQLVAYGILLLRRVAGNTGDGDLEVVDDSLTPLASKINAAFRAIPGTDELRAEQMRMLERPKKGEE